MREREIDNGTVVELTAANKFERRQGKQLFLFLLLLRYPGQDSWGGGGGWSDFHVNGSWYRRLYGKGTVCIRSRIREANLSWPLLDSLILELVLRARRILAFEMDGYIRCGGSGDARWWGTCSTIVSTCLKFFFFFFFRKKRHSSYSAEDFSLLGFEIWRTTVSEQFFSVRVIVAFEILEKKLPPRFYDKYRIVGKKDIPIFSFF